MIQHVHVRDDHAGVLFPEMELATRFCGEFPNGVELGAAAHNPFYLPGSVNVAPFSDAPSHPDYEDFTLYRDEQIRLCGSYAMIDIPGSATRLGVPDGSQYYILSSHVVEHVPNLIAAFEHWNQKLVLGGVVFMIFPKRDAFAPDRDKPITPLDHFVSDYLNHAKVSTHPGGRRSHYHVFDLQSMIKLIDWCNWTKITSWRFEETEKTDSKVGNGHTVVARKV